MTMMLDRDAKTLSATDTGTVPASAAATIAGRTNSTSIPQLDYELELRKLRDPGSRWIPAVTMPEPNSASDGEVSTDPPSPMLSPAKRQQVVGAHAGRLTGIEKWEGYVLEATQSDFTAELTPSDHEGPIVVADFDIEKLAPGDQAEIVVGTSFYLTIRTIDQPGRGRTQTSAIRIRRLGAWTGEVVEAIRSDAKANLAERNATLSEQPLSDEIEVSLFGPGKGESCVVHLGAGRWMIVDSCRDQLTKIVPPLAYLEAIGVDVATQVVLIVATHAHDDHFAGIAEVFERCLAAKFVISDALTSEEFFGLMEAERKQQLINPPHLRPTAYAEYGRVYQIADERFERRGQLSQIKRATESRVLLEMEQEDNVPGVLVMALSPSDEATTRVLRKLANSFPVAGDSIRVCAVDPNECSIAVRIEVGVVVVLLGADLPAGPTGCGWLAVLATSQKVKASLFKVSHHGSPTAHHEDVWNELLSPDPVALVTPFRGGRRPLPAAADQSRLLSLTPNVFLTARSELPNPRASVKRTRAALMSLAKDVREPWGRVGRVTARRSADSAEWTVTTEGPAYALGTDQQSR